MSVLTEFAESPCISWLQRENLFTFCISQRHRGFSVVCPAFLHMLQALPSQATIVSPAALLRHVSSTRAIQQEGAGNVEEPWNQDLLQALLAAIYKVRMPLKHLHNVETRFYRPPDMSEFRFPV